MKLKLCLTALALVWAAGVPANAQENKAEVIHWWTSGGEVEHIAGLADGPHDGVAGFRPDLPRACQRPADGRGRHSRPQRDVADPRFACSFVHCRQ